MVYFFIYNKQHKNYNSIEKNRFKEYTMANTRNKKADLKDRLAALMIYKKLKEESNPDVFISTLEMTRLLEEQYGKENAPSHNTVAKYLKAMKDYSEELEIDVRRGNRKQGYCLGEREFADWEMDLLVSTVMKSKTLSTEDKRDVIFKCYNHLGYGSEEIGVIFDYLKESKDRRKKLKQEEKENVPEILGKLNKAIREKKQIKMYLSNDHSSTGSSSDKHAFFIVNPYKIFTFNDATYLIYGKEIKNSKTMEPFIVSYREIRSIFDVKILDGKNYCSIEKFEPFKNGINQTKLNRDPFGYIKQKENEAVQIEIVSSNDYTIASIKEKLKKEFNEDVEFAHKGNRQIVFMYGNKKKIMQFLFEYSDVCILTGPEKFKKQFKSKLMRTFLKYDSHKKNYSKMVEFINSDDYIEKAHLSAEAEERFRSEREQNQKRKKENSKDEPRADQNVRSYVKDKKRNTQKTKM